jgi:hypothetical protein
MGGEGGLNLLLDTSLYYLLVCFSIADISETREEASCSHSLGSEINSQTQSFDAYRNSFLRVISVIIEIINYPFKLGKMRFKRPYFFVYFRTPPSIFSSRYALRIASLQKRPKLRQCTV